MVTCLQLVLTLVTKKSYFAICVEAIEKPIHLSMSPFRST